MDSERDSDAPRAEPEQQPVSQFPPKPAVKQGELPENTEKERKQDGGATANISRREFRLFEMLSLGISGVLAIIGIWALYIYGGQWEEMRRANDISREALISVQRAFINPKNIEELYFTAANDVKKIVSWGLYQHWENSGNTASKRVKNYISFQTFDGDIPPAFDFQDIGGSNSITMVVGPKNGFHSASLNISPSLMDEVRKRNKRLFVWGWAAYTDIFATTEVHVTEVCNEVIVGGNVLIADPAKGVASFSASYCTKHNCSDRDCPDYDQIVAKFRR